MTRPARILRAHGQDGFILVAILWILVALATFAGAYAAYVSATARNASALQEEAAARPLARAALELTAFRLLAQPATARPASGSFTFRMGKARVAVSYVEETARIDLNVAPLELLAGLFTALGADPKAAEANARHVVAWRSSDPEESPPSEAALYREAQLGYEPRGAPFVHVDELWLIPGLPAELVAAALPHVTVFSGQAQVNAAIAGPVAQAAADIARAGDKTDEPPQDPGRSDAVRVTIRADFDSGRQRTIEAVILLRVAGDVPYRVLAWDEDAPGPAHGRLSAEPGGLESGQ